MVQKKGSKTGTKKWFNIKWYKNEFYTNKSTFGDSISVLYDIIIIYMDSWWYGYDD